MRRTLASWAILLGVVAFVCLPLSALAQRRGGVPFGLNWNRGRPATSALLSMPLTGDCEGTTPAGLTFTRTSTATCTLATGILTTVAANVPRLEAQGLLVEGSATNLALRSEEQGDAAWTKVNASVAADTYAAPNGTTTADTLSTTAAGGFSQCTITTLASTTAVVSVYVRAEAGSQSGDLVLRETGASTGDRCTTNFTATTTWQRVSCAASGLTSGNPFTIRVLPGGAAGSGSVVVWGAQLEAGPVATSYIPTQGTQVTRAAEVPTVATSVSWPTTQGCVSMRYTPLGATGGGANRILFDSRSGTNGLTLFINGTEGLNGRTGNASSATNATTATLTWVAGQSYVLGERWTASLLESLRDGVAVASAVTPLTPTAHSASAFVGVTGTSQQAQGRISNLVVGATVGACQ